MTEMNLADLRSQVFDVVRWQSKFVSLKFLFLATAAALTWSTLVVPGPVQAADEDTIFGTWQGTYTCGNVKGGLTLKLEEGARGMLEGEFHFEITKPRPAQGTYRLRGRYQSGSRSFKAVPAEWIDRPSGYGAVGISGEMLESGLIISGDLSGCGGGSRFEARRGGAEMTDAGTLAVAPDTLTAPSGGPCEGHWSGVVQCANQQVDKQRIPDMQLDIDILQDEDVVVAVTHLEAPSPYGLKRQIWRGSVEGDVVNLGPEVTQLQGQYYTARSARLESAGGGRLSIYLEGITFRGKNCDPFIVSRNGSPQVPSMSGTGDIAGSWSGYNYRLRSRIGDLKRISPLRELANRGSATQLRIEIAEDGGKLYGLYTAAHAISSPPAEQDRFAASIRPLLVLDDGRVAFTEIRPMRAEGVFAPVRGSTISAMPLFLMAVSLEDDGQLLVEQIGSDFRPGIRAAAYRLHRTSEAEAGALALGEAPPAPLPLTLGGTVADAASLDAQCRAFVQWAEPVTSTHDLGRMMVSQGQEAQLSLFEDSAFEPVFGKPYALTTTEERRALNYMVRWICPGRIGMNAIVASALEYGFGRERDFESIVGKLIDRKESAVWHETAMAEIGTLPSDASSYSRLSAIESEAKSRGKEIPPEGQAALHTTLADKRHAIDVAEINKRVARVPALPVELATLNTLKELVKDSGEVTLADADSHALTQAVRAKADAIIGPEIDKAVRAAKNAPKTLEGLGTVTHLAQITSEMLGSLGTILGEQRARQRAAPIYDRRRALIENPDIQQSFAEAMRLLEPGGDPEERVTAAARRYIHSSDFRGSTAIYPYAEAVNRAIAMLEIRSIRFADHSTSTLDGEPTAEEMLLAVKAKFDQINDGLSSTFRRCQAGQFQNDPLMAMQCLTVLGAGGGGEFKVRLTRFEKLGCAEGLNRSGFTCDYVLGFESNSPFMKGRMGELMGTGSVSQGRFIKTPNGWLFTRLR